MKQTLLTICLILFALPSLAEWQIHFFFDSEIDLCIYAADKDFTRKRLPV